MSFQIVFRNIQGSPALEQEIHEQAAGLQRQATGLVRGRVVLEVPHRHHLHGNRVHVRIELSLPGEDVIIDHEPAAQSAGEDEEMTGRAQDLQADHRAAAVAVRDAFEKARRRLEHVGARHAH